MYDIMQCIMNVINKLRFVQTKNKGFKMEWHMTQQCNMQINSNSVLCNSPNEGPKDLHQHVLHSKIFDTSGFPY